MEYEGGMSDEIDGKHGVQSLEIGMGILRAMVDGQRSMMLKEIAAAADMPASKAHRYLVSLIRAGLVEQDPMTSRYDLGPFALNVGLVALDRLDRVRLGLNVISEMRDEINQTTALAVWGDRGPVIVRWERPRRPITVNVITGTVLDLLSSATGRVFAAWMPKRTVTPLIAAEIKADDVPQELKTKAGVEAMLAEVREKGFATTNGFHRVPGVEAVAAPIFNFRNEITMALLVVGVQGMFDTSAEGEVVKCLLSHAEALSARLGATGQPKVPA
jgi:DNA-binding IclR family transcriptional regulator